MTDQTSSAAQASTSRAAVITGWVLTILPSLLFLFSAGAKFFGGKALEEGFAHLGVAQNLAVPLGILELSCVVLFLVPRTAVLGAILLAGYMGGAILTHLRIGEPVFMQVAIGVVVWLGIYLREPRLREILPVRRV